MHPLIVREQLGKHRKTDFAGSPLKNWLFLRKCLVSIATAPAVSCGDGGASAEAERFESPAARDAGGMPKVAPGPLPLLVTALLLRAGEAVGEVDRTAILLP
jgi:hypothetical protein